MAIAVTGGAGYIGGQTAWALLVSGDEVVVVDNFAKGDNRNLPPQAVFEQGSLEDKEFVSSIFSSHMIVIVIHIAGPIIVSEWVTNPLKYYFTNMKIIHHLQACIYHNVRNFIFSSTAAVYGNNLLQLMKEEYTPAPETSYGMSKLIAEDIIKNCANAYGLNYIVLGDFNVIGADPQLHCGQYRDGATHLIKVVSETTAGRRACVHGTDYDTAVGSYVRYFIHVSNIDSAYVSAYDYRRTGKGCSTFNCGYSTGYSVSETIPMAEKISGKKLGIEIELLRPADIVALTDDSIRFLTESVRTSRYSNLETIIASMLKWEVAFNLTFKL